MRTLQLIPPAIMNQVDRLALLLLAFLIPLDKRMVAWVIGLMFLRWLLGLRFITIPASVKGSRTKANLLWFMVFYLLHGVGLLTTSNLQSGLFDLEIKLSLIIFPLIFITLPAEVLDSRRRMEYLLAFVLGAFVSVVINYSLAVSAWLDNGDASVFFYSSLSHFHHPSYAALFLNFAMAICLYILLEQKPSRKWKLWAVGSMLPLFMASVVMLSSKAGILGILLLMFMSGGYLVVRQRMVFQGIAGFIASAAVLYVMISLFPVSMTRLQTATEKVGSGRAIDPGTAESTGERILIWRKSLELAGEHFFTGVGTGDVIDELVKLYRKDGITEAAATRLNPHNQFLQTQLALGLVGTLTLLLMIALPLAEALRRNAFIYATFLSLFGFNILVESMLQTQSGIVFYAFFNTFLYTTVPRGT